MPRQRLFVTQGGHDYEQDTHGRVLKNGLAVSCASLGAFGLPRLSARPVTVIGELVRPGWLQLARAGLIKPLAPWPAA